MDRLSACTVRPQTRPRLTFRADEARASSCPYESNCSLPDWLHSPFFRLTPSFRAIACRLIHDPRPHLHQPLPVPEQLAQIPILRTRHPHPRKAIFHYQLQDVAGIAPVGLLRPHAGRFDLRRVPDNSSYFSSADKRSNQLACPVASISSRTSAPRNFRSR